jgi:hypothetical protein
MMSAFLQAPVEKEIYIQIPKGCQNTIVGNNA